EDDDARIGERGTELGAYAYRWIELDLAQVRGVMPRRSYRRRELRAACPQRNLVARRAGQGVCQRCSPRSGADDSDTHAQSASRSARARATIRRRTPANPNTDRMRFSR